MKRLFLIAALCTVATSTGLAQQRAPGDGGRDPISGILIGLEQPSGEVVATTRTDANGRFSFTNLTPGSYIVKIGGSVSQGATRESKAPRDVATGQASGKRQHGTVMVPTTEVQATNDSVKSPRDVATGQSSGKRTSSVDSVAVKQTVVSPRDPASGLPTGKRAPGSDTATTSSSQVQLEIVDESMTSSRVNTSRSNIKNQRVVEMGEGTGVTVGSSGQLVGNVLKTKHDTVKNSINNVR